MAKVFSISEAAAIALHGVVLIARSENKLNVTKIADMAGASKHHVAKIMQRLVKVGILSSNRGPSGGFSLNQKPENITLLEIYEAIEGEIEITECPVDNEACVLGYCILGSIASKMTKQFKSDLESKTLADVS